MFGSWPISERSTAHDLRPPMASSHRVVTAALLHLAEEVAADPDTLDDSAEALVAVYGWLAGLAP